MSDKYFLDTNIVVYLFSKTDDTKRSIAMNCVDNGNCIISTQVLNELCNVWSKKHKWDSKKIREHIENISLLTSDTLIIEQDTIDSALTIRDKYGFSYYDSLILASALEGECSIVYSEDMSDGQLINNTLKIVNPFNI